MAADFAATFQTLKQAESSVLEFKLQS